MKVMARVYKCEEVEIEIDDKFRKLAVSNPWEHPEIKEEDYDDCVKAVEKIIGLPFGQESADYTIRDEYISTVWSAENDETMLED